jgi:DNA-binding FadR family transcriptional regulator
MMEKFEVMNKNNLYEGIADKLEYSILNENLKLGEKLPSEQALAEQFGVSRNILREALKTLKERGLVEVKNGDGAYITKPKSVMLKDMLNRILILTDATIQDIFEIRFALEIKACELVAEKATQDDIDNLERIIDNMQENIHNRDEFTKNELEFHLTIAKSTKNPLFYSYIKPLSKLMGEMFNDAYTVPVSKNEGIEGHKLILEAIKERNSKLAVQAMTEHLENSKNNLMIITQKARKN